ncbi:MAG TPA: cob(I)yrinic acid a,c-diamide adenosyltransferase [Firmicutes bacterium]|nr:cob(I)yrinic acid a,c-diamide adenosyltransferase [Bacillota bacterium]
MIQVYHGAGKGKTTAAVGLLVRAAGRGKATLLVQFLKDGSSGEIVMLRRWGIAVAAAKEPVPFLWEMTASDRARWAWQQEELLRQAALWPKQEGVLVLDEVLWALEGGLVQRQQVEEVLNRSTARRDIVLTGGHCPDWLKARADYETEFIAKKHPFQQGFLAREGIEY